MLVCDRPEAKEKRLTRKKDKSGGHSSDGRAPALHAGGHRFEPVHLHQFIGGDFDEIVKPMSRKIFVL
jgi:hypothetical protein